MVRGLLEPPPADPINNTARGLPANGNDACSDNSDSDLCLYSAWNHHGNQLFETAPVAEPRCYLWTGTQELKEASGAPPRACVYTTGLTPPPTQALAAEQQVAHARKHLPPSTNTETSRCSSSCSVSSATSSSPLNRNSGGADTSGPCPNFWLLLTHWLHPQAGSLRLKMLLKRRSLLLACSCLLLISCTIASLAISRQVSDRRLTERYAEPRLAQSGPEELEFRSLELVDLIECGKTFAAIKTRLEVQVPRSMPLYHQRPSFLNQRPQTSTIQLAASSPESWAQFMLVETKSNPTEPQDEVVALDSQEHLKGVDELKAQLDSTREAPSPALVAHANTPMGRMLALEADAPDPVEEARFGMHLQAESFNRTLVDCFFVDTEKRFEQKVALEDHYRLVASTRSVPLKHMIGALVECRNIDWERAPSLVIAVASNQGATTEANHPMNLTTKVTTSQQQQLPAATSQQSQQLDFIASLMATILRNQPSDNQLKATSTGLATDSSADTRRSSYSSMGLSMVSGIVPNTLWCGLGDRASNYSQLGLEYRVDSCCRAHDHCPIRLRPLAGDYGLFNWSVSTRSHCDCDQDFNQCLRQINSTLASVIRTLYFRLIGTHCIAVNDSHESTAGT